MDRKTQNSLLQDATTSLSDGSDVLHFSPTPILESSVDETLDKPLVVTSPYKGLNSYKTEDWESFFGRDDLIVQLLNSLSKNNLILLLGASGSGKTSLIQSGLISRLKENLNSKFIEISFKPDRNPFLSFYNSLIQNNYQCEEEITLPQLAQNLQQKDDGSYWLIVIDNFEEFFTLSNPQEAEFFIEDIIEIYEFLKTSPENSVKIKIVLSMRSEYLDNFSVYPKLIDITLTQKNIQAIANLTPENLRLVIEQPANKQGVIFEAGLVDKIIQDARETTNFLPLLQYTLDCLWKQENLSDRTLKINTYKGLGNFKGILTARINLIYNNFTPAEKLVTKTIFINLVKPILNTIVIRRANLSEFDNEVSQRTIEKLVENNLLICDVALHKIEIIHDVLLNSWTTLSDWIEELRQVITLKKQLSEEAKVWQILSQEERNKTINKMWSGAKLEKVDELRKKKMFELVAGSFSPEEEEFINASFALENKLLKAKDKQIQQLTKELVEVKLREQAANIKATLNVRPLEGLLSAIIAIGENLDKLPQQILPSIQASLNFAMEVAKEQNILKGHEDRVNAVAISPDGKIIVSGSWDKTLQLWNSEGNPIEKPFRGHEGEITSVAFSPDGQTIASSSGDGTVRLWNLKGIAIGMPMWGHEGDVTSVAISGDGQTIASSGVDGTIRLWDLQGNPIGQPFYGHEGDVTSVAISGDGQTIASGGGDGTVRLWDLQGTPIGQPFGGHEDKVAAIAFSPDGQTIASSSWDATVRLWDIQGKAIGKPFRGHDDYVIAIAFDPQGKMIASGSSDKTIRLWDLNGNRIGQPLRGHRSSIRSLIFSPDGKTVISGSTDKTLRLWDLAGNAIARPFQGHDVSVWSVAFSRDGQTMVSGGGDGTVRIWDRNGKQIGQAFRGHAGDVTSVALSPDGEIIASGSWDRTIRLWDLQGNAIAPPFQGHEDDITSVAFSPDGEIIASGSWDKTVRLWDKRGNAIAQPLRGHQGDVTAVAFSPDGEIIASGSWDKTIRLWDKQGNAIAKPFEGHQERVNAVVFSPNGNAIASGGGDGTIRLWDLQGNAIGQPFGGHEGYVSTVAFSYDGQILVSGGSDGTIRLWDLQGNAIAQPFEIPKSEVTTVAFSPDDRVIVSGSLNGLIHLWQGGGWQSWLQVCGERLRYHPAFKNPQTDLENLALAVCQKHLWNPVATEWNKRGIARLEEDAFEIALEYFDRALQIHPHHVGALYNRARTYVNLGDAAKAIQDFDRLIETVPTHATAYLYRGQCYGELSDRAKAIADTQQAAALYQQQGQDANYKKAIAYLHQLQR
ncbi:MAG: tetratricopeptide repeat protein [Hydrococcus sp. Prado102]|jgi:WD40 repeat protein/Flp pilus assembly protein TadD|nr:tetratricopeptide repeat protein [Hydrococcus sp. Prado102]